MALLHPPGAVLVTAGAAQRPLVRAESIVALMRRDLPPLPCYVGPALVPKGAKVVLGGQAKIGKSFLAMELSRAIATGGRLFHGDSYCIERPAKLLYVEQEIGQYGMQDRSRHALGGEDPDVLERNFHYITKAPGIWLDTEDGRKILEAAMDEVQPEVLVLDPASKFLGDDDGKQEVVRNFWAQIDVLMKRFKDLTVIVLHHFKKPPAGGWGDDPDEALNFYNFRGSSSWVNEPDTICMFRRDNYDVTRQEWLLTFDAVTRLGRPPARTYLRIRPESPQPVMELPAYEGERLLEQAMEMRAAEDEKRKVRKGSSKRGSDPLSGEERISRWT